MTKISFHIRPGSILEAVALSRQIPEFDNPHDEQIYQERLSGKTHLIIIAESQELPVGFKVGYDKFGDSSFYTWMGGVLPEYRSQGIAKSLASYQEKFAKEEGFDSVILKTRNRHKNMLRFAISSGFEIIDVDERIPTAESRILLKKILS
ncbi:MAG: GNAT family N-acetyltransferase [Reichenbachiella sp.]|uniref:GNAT family N-acetyltransferase n=1 Tax=Reichenbachiella sp. TaxID=2184521 RepID=UPI0032659586